MNLLTVDFLSGSGTLSDLEQQFGITAKRHPQYPNLVFLKYSQIDSPMSELIVQECRGLILDESDGWRVISFPFRKFFNSHEGHAATIDWTTAEVYEKLDGSLMTLYWYDGKWQVASNGTPDAGGDVYGHNGTFADLFWETFNELGLKLPERCMAAPETCYMLELMTPYNRVVVPHAESNLALIGVREVESPYYECPVQPHAEHLGWPCVRSYPLQTIDDCLSAAGKLNAMESEGYVVVDADFNRIKVKCPQYVALSRLKESMSPRHMLELVRKNEGDEFLSYFPEMRPLFDSIKTNFDLLCAEVDADYASLSRITSQKDFALDAVKTRCSSALFSIRAGKAKSARDYFASATFNAVERFMPKLPGLEAVAGCLEGA